MAQQPYIPLYIGDWEQDVNILSLEAEAAWLRIIFKMFKGDKSGIYKIHTKGLQNLWKKTESQVIEIVNELKICEICSVIEENDFFVFKNRRMIREKEISKKRSIAGQSRYKSNTKGIQPHEYEYVNDNEVDNELIEKYPFEDFWEMYDKKIGRPKSQKKWMALSDKDREAIIAYIPKYKKAQPEKKYRKHPETFLNNRSWEDELIGENKSVKDEENKVYTIEQ